MKVDTTRCGDITLYTLTNATGASVTLSTLGAAIVAVCVPDKDGKLDDVALGYKNRSRSGCDEKSWFILLDFLAPASS